MKKVLLVIAAIMATMSVQAQDEKQNELSISYGIGISMIGDGIGNGIGNGLIDSWSGCEWDNDKQFGTLSLEYFRHLDDPRLAVGAILTFAQYGEDVVKKDNHTKVGDRTRSYISLMPSLKYYWVNGKNFGFYSKIAAGAMLLSYKDSQSSSDSKVYFMGQASPIGLEAGSSSIRGFLEAGVGEQGILLAGLRMKF